MNIKKLLLLATFGIIISSPAIAQTIPMIQFHKTTVNTKLKTKAEAYTKAVSYKIDNALSDTSKANFASSMLNTSSFFDLSDQKTKKDSISQLRAIAKSFPNMTSEGKRDILLKGLKSRIKRSDVYDTTLLTLLKDTINYLKAYNTEEFLTTRRPPKPFLILQIGKYSVDSLNKFFYNQANIGVFQNAAVQNFTGSKSYITTELASFLFGPVRMGVGGTFLSKGDTSKDNGIKTSIQKIVTNGGAINFNFSLPLLFCRSAGDQTHFSIFAQMNNGINPGVDSTGTDFSKNVSFINQSGLIFHFDAGSNDGKALLSFDLPCYYSASSNNLKSQLGLPNFAVVKLQVGANINQLINIHISGPLLSSSKTIQNTPFIVSLQFSPGQAAKLPK